MKVGNSYVVMWVDEKRDIAHSTEKLRRARIPMARGKWARQCGWVIVGVAEVGFQGLVGESGVWWLMV